MASTERLDDTAALDGLIAAYRELAELSASVDSDSRIRAARATRLRAAGVELIEIAGILSPSHAEASGPEVEVE